MYFMKDARGKILYVGKAGNLRRRVESYFSRPHDARIEKLVREIRKIDYQKTDTALEALILEAELIKKHRPPFNVREKDDKSFLYVQVTSEKFPRVLLVRGKDVPAGKRYGPFTSASSIREALRIMRRIFPFSVHQSDEVGKRSRPCLDYELGLCPGTCIGAADKLAYQKSIKNLKLFFEGTKNKVLASLARDMKRLSEELAFEEAGKVRRQIFALQHIRDIAFITETDVKGGNQDGNKGFRIEGYDISNISGTSAVGAMVVFEDGKPAKAEYRKFKIWTLKQPNDVGMLQEVLRRRLRHTPPAGGWPLPDLILIDGGAAQANVGRRVLAEFGFRIPVVGIAKGPKRKRNDIIGSAPKGVDLKTLVRVRDEAHRFAVRYHRALRGAIVRK